jgi:acetyl esterase/lipase
MYAMASSVGKQIREMLLYEIAPKFTDTPLEVQRKTWEAMGAKTVLPESIKVEPLTAGGVPAEWVFSSKSASDRVVLYLHGGGQVMGSCNTHRGLASDLALASSVRVLLIDYRLAPENPPPSGLEDAMGAYRWLISQGIDNGRIVIAGDSAGGGLTISTFVALRDAGDPLPAAGVLLSPMVDWAIDGESVTSRAQYDPMLTKQSLNEAATWLCGDQDPKTPYISPLYAELHGLPPLYIVVGADEILLSDSTRLTERVAMAGGGVSLEVWPDMWHVFQFFASVLPEGKQSLEKIGVFIRKHLADSLLNVY